MFLCWCSSKELPANEAHWFGPWSRKIPHTLERLSLGTSITDPVLQRLGATTPEPVHHRACAPQEKPPQWEARAPQLEKILCSNKDAAQLKINTNKSNANLVKNRKSQQGNRNYKNNQIAFLELRDTVTKIKTLLDGLSGDDKE